MRTPSLVKELCLAMRDGAGEDTPITVKCRIGVDDDDSYEQLAAFVDEVRRHYGIILLSSKKSTYGNALVLTTGGGIRF